MPKKTIPLIFNPSQRGFGAEIAMTKDAIMSGVVPIVVSNSTKGEKSVYVQKRVGWVESYTTSESTAITGTAVFYSPSTGEKLAAFYSAASGICTIWKDGITQGTLKFTAAIDHIASHISEMVIAEKTYYLITAHNNTADLEVTSGWYLVEDADDQTAYVGDTHSNTVVDNIASTTGMYVGQLIAGSGIPANTRIATITSATAITITNAATATAAGVSLTKTPIALILDADFPLRIIGQFVELNGRAFIMRQNGEVHQSGLGDINTWTSSGYVPTDLVTDVGMGLVRYKNNIVAFGTDTAEILENVGNPSGSVLLSRQGEAFGVGAFRSSISPFRNSWIAGDVFRIAWIAVGGNDTEGVWLLDRNGMRNIGGDVINKLVAKSDATSISIISAMGQSFVHVSTEVAGARNLLYSIEADLWVDGNFERQFALSGSPVSEANNIIAVFFRTSGGVGGIVYKLDQFTPAYQDDSANYAWTITTDNYSLNNGEPFIITHIDLIADTQSSGTVTATASEDDFASFVGLGDFDLAQQIKRIDGCGWFPSTVAFKLTETANRQFRAQALNVYWVPCGRPN